MNYKSQIGQDKYVLDNVFANKKKGYFIELGGADGVIHSNTYYMEKELDWNGICIEPNPKYHEDLKKNRNCHKEFCPVYSSSGKEVEFSVVNCGELSGISNHMGRIGDYKVTNKIMLKTKTLTEILDKYNAPRYIDYLSLDVEGAELEVLKGLDFNKYTIGYICLEHNFRPYRNKIKNFLKNKKYIFSRWNRFDDEFMHATLAKNYAWSTLKCDITPNPEQIKTLKEKKILIPKSGIESVRDCKYFVDCME